MVEILDVPRDPQLPWLPAALDGEGMRRRLQPFFEPRAEILQVKVGRFTYKPGRSARLAYRVKLLDRERAVKLRHVLHGRMERTEDVAHQYRKSTRRPWVAPRYGPPVLFLADLDLLLFGFPNDPKLAGIELLTQPEKLLGLLARSPIVAEFAPVGCESTAVKYVPGKRLVMRHRLRNAADRHLLLYSKTYGHEGGAAIHAVLQALAAASRDDPGAFACPDPIAYRADERTLFLTALPGTAATASLDSALLEARMRSAGGGLACVHASGVQGLEPWDAADEARNFVKALGMLRRHDPAMVPATERLAALAAAGPAECEPLRPVPIHTAFRYSQLLEYRGRLALVDFDGFRQGHPMCDVGSFVAHLLYLQAKGDLPRSSTRAAVDAFLAGYAARAPWGIANRALRWYAGVILTAKHAQKCVKRLKDDHDVKIRHLLETATRLLDGSEPLV